MLENKSPRRAAGVLAQFAAAASTSVALFLAWLEWSLYHDDDSIGEGATLTPDLETASAHGKSPAAL